MNELWLNLTDVIVQPTQAFRRLRDRPLVGWALVVVLVSQVVGMLNEPTGFESLDPQIPGWLTTILAVPFWLLGALVFLLVGRALKGSGSYASLVSTTGFAQTPGIFYAPLALVGAVAGDWITWLGGLIIMVWQLVLGVIALREALHLSTGRAVGTILLSGLIIAIAIGVLAFVLALLIGFAISPFAV